ncbi:MAG: Ig-like domain-containing protein, partial [Candidatus Thorarchaeota archaeon]
RAVLHYSVAGGSWNEVDMSSTGDTYAAEIPAVEYGVEVSYYVTATDSVGHSSSKGTQSSPYAYTVGDKTPPTISFAFDINIERHNGLVYFTVNASDAGSGLESIKVYVDDTLIATLGPTETEYLWDPSTVPPGAHNVTFVAVDLVGNSASASVTIKTGGGLGGLGEAFAAVLSTYGIAIGFGAVIVGYIVLRIVIAKRRGK